MNIQKIFYALNSPFRIRRMRHFLDTMTPSAEQPILDVGGSSYNWNLVNYKNRVILLNLDKGLGNIESANLEFMVGDATDMPFDDGEYEVVFSN